MTICIQHSLCYHLFNAGSAGMIANHLLFMVRAFLEEFNPY